MTVHFGKGAESFRMVTHAPDSVTGESGRAAASTAGTRAGLRGLPNPLGTPDPIYRKRCIVPRCAARYK